MIDPRNRPALIGSALAGVAAFVVLWFLGLSPILAWIAGFRFFQRSAGLPDASSALMVLLREK